MKRKSIIILIALTLIAVIALTGCTAKFKQKAIATDLSPRNLSIVNSNGGLAVRVGKYLYFINGIAGQDGYNTWGHTVKGAIMRVELNDDDTPNRSTLTTIIPKNVFAKRDTGLVVLGDRIFFTSPSTSTDGKGNPITTKMVLFQAKLDGTDVKQIKEFKNYEIDYHITSNGHVLFVEESKLYDINLGDRKLKSKLIDEELAGFKFMSYGKDMNSMTNTVFYAKASDKTTDKFNVIWKYEAGGTKKEAFNGNPKGSYAGKTDIEDINGYSLTVVQLVPVGKDVVRLVYNKTDNGANKKSAGTYSFDFTNSNSFDWKKEVRYGTTTYTDIKFIGSLEDKKAGKYVLATGGSGISYSAKLATPNGLGCNYELDDSSSRVITVASTKIEEILETKDGVTIRYSESNKVKSREILKLSASGYEIIKKTIQEVFSKTLDTSWLKLDIVDGIYYYFNTDVEKNIYYYNPNKVVQFDKRTTDGYQLGKISQADELKMLKQEEAPQQ